MKLTKRKAFKFFRSYYDVYNELTKDSDKIAFIEALLDKQFLGVDPDNLKGMAKFAYISQINSIDSQVSGYEAKTNTSLGGTQGGMLGAVQGASLQEKEKEKEKYINPFKKWDEKQFIESIKSLNVSYDKDDLNAFANYWTEQDSKGRMRFQLNKTWDTNRRLNTWMNNKNNFKK